MAGRTRNRLELRKQAEQAEQIAQAQAETGAAGTATPTGTPKKAARTKAAATTKPKKTRKKKEAVRMCARWGVFDASMKQLAIFDYSQRALAEQKVADLSAKKSGVYFLQIIKEPMPEAEVEESPSA